MHSRLLLVAAMSWPALPLAAQGPPKGLVEERTEYLAWLRSAPTSPFAAIALQRIGEGITLGPEGSDIPLPGITDVRVTESATRVALDSAGTSRPLVRNRVTPLGRYKLLAAGTPGRVILMVFATPRAVNEPEYFPYQVTALDTVTLTPPAQRQTLTLLSPEGIDVEAAEAGSVTVKKFGAPVALRVRRLPGPTADEWELEIYFRDGSSGQGSYPAGRFVSLVPLANGKFVLDFNRARNPFCAYSTVYPCPAPWTGNTIAARIDAGEMYQPSGQ